MCFHTSSVLEHPSRNCIRSIPSLQVCSRLPGWPESVRHFTRQTELKHARDHSPMNAPPPYVQPQCTMSLPAALPGHQHVDYYVCTLCSCMPPATSACWLPCVQTMHSLCPCMPLLASAFWLPWFWACCLANSLVSDRVEAGRPRLATHLLSACWLPWTYIPNPRLCP